ncbi:MAG: aldehyde dehydrogenase family protein [Verrucomicrobiota bacterium]|nr:aldehyde dehydrogenase family protein [Verrucomicrobiota bacterium]MDG1890943.1 aldehyde dehydrogenase family protein [Verrucomicrobiota bacterium]
MKSLNTHPFVNGRSLEVTDSTVTPQLNPANEEIFSEVHNATLEQLEMAVAGAQRAFETQWRQFLPNARARCLSAIAQGIRDEKDRLAAIETQNIGKPIQDARDEIELGARIFEYYAGAVGKDFGQTIPVSRKGLNLTLREPMGVIGAIVPWNFPFPIACWKIAPALAAGNTAVLKPSSLSPLTALSLGKIATDSGLPPGVLQVLPGAGKLIGEALTRHPMIKKISFTGSTQSGARVMQLAAEGIKRISLELGGKSPNIVFADADMDKAAGESPLSVFANAGQDCCARSRVFVEDSAFETFVNQFVTATRNIRVDDPTLSGTQMGPLISGAQRDHAEAFIEEARKAGRHIALGGDRPRDRGFFLNPTIILEPDLDDASWRDEIFGPVVCIRRFKEESTMLREVNDTPYGLSGSIWTQNISRAIRVARGVESGVLSINTHSSVHVEAPFGGYKQSGIGRDLGMQALDGYSEIKNIFIAE